MRVLVIVKASEASERGQMPTEQQLAAMGKYNEELVSAGLMLGGEGLHPSSRGARIAFDGRERRVVRGPFLNPSSLVAGFWIWKVESMEEAVAWLKRAPFDQGEEVEVRPILEAEDFGDALTPDLREQEGRLRAQLERQQTK